LSEWELYMSIVKWQDLEIVAVPALVDENIDVYSGEEEYRAFFDDFVESLKNIASRFGPYSD